AGRRLPRVRPGTPARRRAATGRVAPIWHAKTSRGGPRGPADDTLEPSCRNRDRPKPQLKHQIFGRWRSGTRPAGAVMAVAHLLLDPADVMAKTILVVDDDPAFLGS